MIYRLICGCIVLFWLLMTGLLFRSEWWPGYTSLRDVPVEHVVKLLLIHGETSELNILNEKAHLGRLRIHPMIRKSDNARLIDFMGNIQIRVPGLERQNLEWKGDWEMDKALATRRFSIALTMRKPALVTMEFHAIPAENRAHYSVVTGTAIQEDRDFSLDAAGLRAVFQQLGFDSAMLDAAQSPNAEKPVITARQAFLEVHGGKIDTYLVTVEHSGQTLIEFHVDQLGRILQVKTLIGYSLAPDDLTP